MTERRSWPRPLSWTIPIGMWPHPRPGHQCSESLTATSPARTVFKAVPDLHFIFLIVPSYMSLGSTLVTVFNPVGSVPCLTFNEDFAVYVCHRHSHYPQLHIRKARVEDHDDLMPIFMRHDTVLKDTYGEYFLAELIEAQDQENHAVVCEGNQLPGSWYFRLCRVYGAVSPLS
uniref:Cilia- and flagella-associated protein 61 N-terminal domain-containing protein n=1 Tax=Cavia porcellus TaxID=10141 RepID=A0A286XKQ3_CAVPO